MTDIVALQLDMVAWFAKGEIIPPHTLHTYMPCIQYTHIHIQNTHIHIQYTHIHIQNTHIHTTYINLIFVNRGETDGWSGQLVGNMVLSALQRAGHANAYWDEYFLQVRFVCFLHIAFVY